MEAINTDSNDIINDKLSLNSFEQHMMHLNKKEEIK